MNNDKRDLIFDEYDLPWHIVGDSMKLVLMEEDVNELIRRTPIIIDRGVALPVTIKTGQVKSKEVYLDRYYNDLSSVLLRHDVTMLWVYKPKPENAKELEPIVGQLRLARIQ